MPKTIPSLLTPPELQRLLGRRLKALRLHAGYKRTTLAERSGVSVGSLRRFESSGEVSLKNLLRLVHALGRLPELAGLLELPEARSLAELEARAVDRQPKRGRI